MASAIPLVDPSSYGYYDAIRQSPTATFVSLVPPVQYGLPTDYPGGRNLYRAIDEESDLPSPGVILAHIPTFLRWTQIVQSTETDTDTELLYDTSDSGYDGAAAAILAMHHFNNGMGSVVDELEGINETCSIRLTTESVDTMGWELISTVTFLEDVVVGDYYNASEPKMAAMVGTTTSKVSSTLAAQSSVFDLPQFSPSATSALLDNPYEYFYFGRTIASDDATSGRLTAFLKKELDVTYFGMIYVDDAYGGAFHQSTRQWTHLRNMTLHSYALKPGSTSKKSVDQALTYLQNNKVNIIIGVFYPTQYELIMGQAWLLGMAGEGKLWIFTAAMEPGLAGNNGVGSLDPSSPAAKATPGNMVFHNSGGLPDFFQYDRFLRDWRQVATDDAALDYINSKVPPWGAQAIFTNGTVLEFNRTANYFLRNPSYIASYTYDAVVALGLGACYAQGNLSLIQPTSSVDSNISRMDWNTTFSGSEHHSYTLASRFLGATGQVSFGIDGSFSRDPNTTYFVVSNIREQRTEEGTLSFFPVPTHFLELTTNEWTSYRNRTFLFPGGATEPPPDLPPPDTVLVHLDPIARGICLALCGLAMLAALFFLYFTISKRENRIVKASQPEFLILICIGCLLMASTIIPLSMDTQVASERGCDVACQSKFWLVSVGFCLTFTALFSKLWRVNRVMKNAKGFRKVKITALDVIVPGAIILGCNILVLTVWTIMSPMIWEIRTVQYDEFGRPKVQVGSCNAQEGNALAFIGSLLAIDGVAILITLWQAYEARHITTDLSESKYIGLAVVAIFEASFIGVPVIYIVNDQPNAVLFLSTAVIFVSVLAILGFLFGPKYKAYWKKEGLSPSVPHGNYQPGANARRNDSQEVLRLNQEIARLKQELEAAQIGAPESAAATIGLTERAAEGDSSS